MFEIRVQVADKYRPGVGWAFLYEPEEAKTFVTEEDAWTFYREKIQDAPVSAALSGKAVRVQMRTGDTMTATHVYEGELVRWWYAAYHQKGQHPAEERFTIDRIYSDTFYYAAMQPSEDGRVETVAIAETLEELLFQLGREAGKYEVLG